MSVGVAIVAFDRPHYLRRTLASLEQQNYAGAVDYHLFLDGAVNKFSGRVAGRRQGIDQSRLLFLRSELPGRGVHQQVQNLGVGLHMYAATEWMTAHYDRVMICEDDVVLSPHWLRLAMGLLDQFEGRDDIFGFSPGYKKQGDDLDALWYQSSHWFCETFTARAWKRMKPYYQDYLNIIRGVDYRDRDHEAIRALYRRRGFEHPATSQDAAKDMAIWCAGMQRVICVVNRALAIGREGVHMTANRFRLAGYENQAPYIFGADRTRGFFDEPIGA